MQLLVAVVYGVRHDGRKGPSVLGGHQIVPSHVMVFTPICRVVVVSMFSVSLLDLALARMPIVEAGLLVFLRLALFVVVVSLFRNTNTDAVVDEVFAMHLLVQREAHRVAIHVVSMLVNSAVHLTEHHVRVVFQLVLAICIDNGSDEVILFPVMEPRGKRSLVAVSWLVHVLQVD